MTPDRDDPVFVSTSTKIPWTLLLVPVGVAAVLALVSPASAQPAANFTYDPSGPEAGEPIDFQDTSDGQIVAWTWTFDDGTTSNDQHPNHTYDEAGTYQVELTVEDENGDNDTTTETVDVDEPLQAAFSYDPSNPSTGETVTFTNESTGPIVDQDWDLGDGTTSSAQDPTHAYDEVDKYTVSLTVTGEDGATDTATQNLTVEAGLNASFTADCPGLECTFDARDSAGNVSSYSWTLGDGNTSAGARTTHAYASEATYDVQLTVEDEEGDTDTTARSLEVTAGEPTAAFTYTPQDPAPGEEIAFDGANSSSPNGPIESYTWVFSEEENETTSSATTTHTYSQEGSAQPELVITDEAGYVAGTAKELTIAERLEASFTSTCEDLSCTFDAASSTGNITTYRWEIGSEDPKTGVTVDHTFDQEGTYHVNPPSRLPTGRPTRRPKSSPSKIRTTPRSSRSPRTSIRPSSTRPLASPGRPTTVTPLFPRSPWRSTVNSST